MVCSDYAICSQSIEKNVFDHSYSNSHHRAKNNVKNQNSNSCKMISKLFLLEDLRFHILTLVPLNSILHSTRYVCKSWAATIRNSHFVEMCEHQIVLNLHINPVFMFKISWHEAILISWNLMIRTANLKGLISWEHLKGWEI